MSPLLQEHLADSSKPTTVDDLIALGPIRLAEFVSQAPTDCQFDPTFSWLLLTEAINLELGETLESGTALVAAWAKVGAMLYEGLASGCRPQDDLARDIWTRRAALYRSWLATSLSTTPTNGAVLSRENQSV